MHSDVNLVALDHREAHRAPHRTPEPPLQALPTVRLPASKTSLPSLSAIAFVSFSASASIHPFRARCRPHPGALRGDNPCRPMALERAERNR